MNEIERTENPLESIANTLAFSSFDFTVNKRAWWLWSIVFGNDAIPEIQVEDSWNFGIERFGIEPEEIERLKRLHQKFIELNNNIKS